jgi:serine phosphatase RsbU (regulator of sigma subunit)
VIGALALGVKAGVSRVDADFLQLAGEVAERAALAYENARLFVRQRTIADTLQRSLLPVSLPQIAGLDISARYWAAGNGVDVGGDFYDVLRVPDEPGAPVVAFVGDVCGKGVEAAAVTALARHTLRAAVAHEPDPSTALQWLHEAVRARSEDSFVTVALLRLQPNAGAVDVDGAIGGHPRPIVLRADGETEELSAAGSAPGLPLWRPAPTVRTTLRPGDAIVVYTDGVTDVPGDAALSAEEVREFVSGLAGSTADEIATEIGVHVERLRPRHEREDDFAVLVLRAVEPAS